MITKTRHGKQSPGSSFLSQCPWLYLPCDVTFPLSTLDVEKSMPGTLLRSWTLERKDNHPSPGGSLSTPQTALSLLSFCVGSHKSAERQEGLTQRPVWGSGQPGSRARAWRAGVGWGIKPNPVWPVTHKHRQERACLGRPSPGLVPRVLRALARWTGRRSWSEDSRDCRPLSSLYSWGNRLSERKVLGPGRGGGRARQTGFCCSSGALFPSYSSPSQLTSPSSGVEITGHPQKGGEHSHLWQKPAVGQRGQDC